MSEMTSNDVLSCTPHEDKVTKAMFRFKVWNLLENKDLVRFPRPCKGRIPNFVDCNDAAEKLTSLDVFKKSEVVKVNMDKPQEAVRFAVLEEGKTLLVPVPSLSEGVVTKVCPPPNATRGQLSLASKRRGAEEYGETITLNEKLHVDMIVIGSVAVSKEGHRIGKGEGFSDLEYGLMAATGLVSEDTVVVTTVHDEQVFEHLPHDLFQQFDVPVDFIITPTQVIGISPKLPKPKGILWNAVSDRRLQLIPLLKTLRNKEIEEGNECLLKEVDSEPEERPKPYYRPSFQRRRHFMRPHREYSREPQPRQFKREERREFNPESDRRQFIPETERRQFNPDRERRQFNPDRERRQVSRDSQRRQVSRDPRRSESEQMAEAPRRTRTFRRGGNRPKPVDNSVEREVQVNGHSQERGGRMDHKIVGENKENQQPQSRPRPLRRVQRRFYKPNKIPVDFSVKVGNIAATMRVRDLKAALIEKGVRPRDITWKGPKGFALLHFAKFKTEEEQPMAVDDVIASLQGLTVKCKSEEEVSERHLSVEPAKPISRIEDAGVTAV